MRFIEKGLDKRPVVTILALTAFGVVVLLPALRAIGVLQPIENAVNSGLGKITSALAPRV